jgi:hypothetical protein
MKYLVVTDPAVAEPDRRDHLVLFPEDVDHSNALEMVKRSVPQAVLRSAGKFYLEKCDCYPGERYVSFRPGSVTLSLSFKTPEMYQEHAARALSLLSREFTLRVDERRVFAAPTLPGLFGSQPGVDALLTLAFSPPDRCCPRAVVAVAGLDAEASFYFWQAFRS